MNSKSDTRSFKERKSLEARVEEVQYIRNKFPSKIPVIVERYAKERTLGLLDKSKFLVPQELTLSQFVAIIRTRLRLSPTQALYVLVNARVLANMSSTLAEIYSVERDPDGFLYMTYASQEMFGGCSA